MEKIRLTNEQEFDLVILGNISDPVSKKRILKFTSDLGIGEVQAMFKDEVNISSIDHYLPTGTLISNFSDCVAYKSISQDATGVYIVELSTDAVEKQLKDLQAKVALLEAAKIEPAPDVSTPEA